jgi:hypothetical protein
MKKTLITLLAFFTSLSSIIAQNPWTGKLYLHFLDSNNAALTDTIWFGCDSLGGVGYQSGLDKIDTTVTANKAIGSDSQIRTAFNTGCGNVKQNVLGFALNNVVRFPFYSFGKIVGISWDTLDFVFPTTVDTTYKFRSIILKSTNAFLFAIDAYDFVLYNYYRSSGFQSDFSFHDSIPVIADGNPVIGCNHPYQMSEFMLEVWMGKFNVRLDELHQKSDWTIYPNPTVNSLFIKSENTDKTIATITDVYGNTYINRVLLLSDVHEIDTKILPAGIYFLTLQTPSKISTHKIIKQ